MIGAIIGAINEFLSLIEKARTLISPLLSRFRRRDPERETEIFFLQILLFFLQKRLTELESRNLAFEKKCFSLEKANSSLQEEILRLKQEIFDLEREKADLMEKIQEHEEEKRTRRQREIDKTRYRLAEFAPGVYAYRYEPKPEEETPVHWLCPQCFEEGRKSLIQRAGREGNGWLYQCPKCEFRAFVYEPPPPPVVKAVEIPSPARKLINQMRRQMNL